MIHMTFEFILKFTIRQESLYKVKNTFKKKILTKKTKKAIIINK